MPAGRGWACLCEPDHCPTQVHAAVSCPSDQDPSKPLSPFPVKFHGNLGVEGKAGANPWALRSLYFQGLTGDSLGRDMVSAHRKDTQSEVSRSLRDQHPGSFLLGLRSPQPGGFYFTLAGSSLLFNSTSLVLFSA